MIFLGLCNLILVSLVANLWIYQNGLANAEFCGYPFQSLPRWFSPMHYDVELNPHIQTHSHNGQVKILINSVAPREAKRQIIMHAGSNLKIERLRLYHVVPKEDSTSKSNEFSFQQIEKDNREMKIKGICHDEKYDILVIEIDQSEMQEPVTASMTMAIVIDFSGSTTTNGQGLVRVGYDDPLAAFEAKRILYSKFDRFKAHFVFPCFDEPRLMATFKMRLGNIAPYENAFSTFLLEVNERILIEGRSYRRYTFYRTFPISINSLGFVVGTLDHRRLTSVGKDNVTLTFMKTQGFRMQSRKTEELLEKAFQKTYNFFDYKFPIKYIGFVAHPGIGKAFESHMAGLSVVDANSVIRNGELDSDEETTVSAKLVDVICRQYYGFIVAQDLDEDSWFFEGMLGWLTMKLTDRVTTGTNYGLLYTKREVSKALHEDAKPDARPLLVPQDYTTKVADLIKECDQSKFIHASTLRVQQLPASVTRRGDYPVDDSARVKSIAAIRSYEQACTNFSAIVKEFLRKFRYKMVQVRDFVSMIQRECRWQSQNFKDLFVGQAGFPLIKVRIETSYSLIASQERFHLDDTDPELAQQYWIIPVSYGFGDYFRRGQFERNVILFKNARDTRIKLGQNQVLTRPGSWLKLNVGVKGFYRVLYSDQLLNSLLMAIHENVLYFIDCLNLLDDAMAFLRAGKVGAYYLVATLRAVSQLDNELLHNSSISAFKEVRKLYIQYNTINDGISEMGVQLFANHFLEHGFRLDDLGTSEGLSARIQIYETLAKLDFEPIVSKSIEIYMSDQLSALDERFHGTMFISVSRHGSDHNFVEMIEHLTSNLVERSILDQKIVIGMAYATDIGRLRLAWRYVKTMSSELIEHFIMTLMDTMDGQLFALSEVIPEVGGLYSSIGADRFLPLMEHVCNQLAKNTRMCWFSSPLRDVVGRDRWNEMVYSVRETRRHNFYLQQLDINKLVF